MTEIYFDFTIGYCIYLKGALKYKVNFYISASGRKGEMLMKKILSFILAAVLLSGTLLPVSAADLLIPEGCENYVVPDDVTFIGAEIELPCSSLTVNSPDCVIEPDEKYETDVMLCGVKGSAAEKTAAQNDYPFILLGEGHVHTYINVIKSAATCVTDGKVITYCPCGETQTKTTVVPATGEHHYVFTYPLMKYVCSVCGEPKPIAPIVIDDDDDGYIDEDDCTCVCHADENLDLSSLSSLLDCVLYRIKLLFWRLTHTHQVCECGRRHY